MYTAKSYKNKSENEKPSKSANEVIVSKVDENLFTISKKLKKFIFYNYVFRIHNCVIYRLKISKIDMRM